MKKNAILFLIFLLCSLTFSFSEQPSVGQIQKAQENIEMDKILRTEVEKGKKVYVKRVIVKGASLITEGQIKEIILPFQKHWLTGNDIDLILDSISSAYKNNGYEGEPSRISFEVKRGVLEINVKEVKY